VSKSSLLAIASLWASGGACAAGENLLRNAGFEEGEGSSFAAWAPVWPRTLSAPPGFARLSKEPREGKSAAEIRVAASGGFCSLTQVIDEPPAEARIARLEGWVRGEKGT